MKEETQDPEVIQIYQKNPYYTKVLKKNDFPDKGWCDSIQGFQREAKQLKYCLIRNKELSGRPYTWFATVNFHVALPPKTVTESWKTYRRRLKDLGVVGMWVREVNLKNAIHMHFILRSDHTEKSLKEAFKKAMPKQNELAWHMSQERIGASDWNLFAYIAKSKEPGRNVDGTPTEDRFAQKRLLFKKKIGIPKVGSFGGFWIKSRKEIWAESRETEKTIAQGMAIEGIREEAIKLYDVYGGSISLRKIERDLAYHAASKSVS